MKRQKPKTNGTMHHPPLKTIISETEIIECMVMAKKIVRIKFRSVIRALTPSKRSEFVDEARQEAYLAISKACLSYKTGKGTKFKSWAYIVIHSELRMFNRSALSKKRNPKSEYGNVSLDKMLDADSEVRTHGGDVYYSPVKRNDARLENRLPELAQVKSFTSEQILPLDDEEHRKHLVEKLLQALPGGSKKQVVLMLLKGCTTTEIALRLKMSTKNVQLLFNQAIETIRADEEIKPLIEEGL